MQHVILFYYLVSLIIGLSSIISLSFITVKARNPFFTHYLFFNVFYTLLITALLISLYMEVNFQALFETYQAYSKLVIFFIKCGLVYTLIAFCNFVFDIPRKKIINFIVFLLLLCSAILRLVSFFNIFPDEAEEGITSLPISRLVVDGLLILGLLYLFILRLFRLQAVAPEEFKKIIRLITLVIALFAPALILEILFYTQWGFALFTPAMYCVVSLVFAFKLTGYFIGNYQLSEGNVNRITDQNNPAFASFVKKYGISKREEEIVICLLKGDTNNKIAADLFISASTVKAHIYNIFKKTAVKTRHQLFFKILRQN